MHCLHCNVISQGLRLVTGKAPPGPTPTQTVVSLPCKPLFHILSLESLLTAHRGYRVEHPSSQALFKCDCRPAHPGTTGLHRRLSWPVRSSTPLQHSTMTLRHYMSTVTCAVAMECSVTIPMQEVLPFCGADGTPSRHFPAAAQPLAARQGFAAPALSHPGQAAGQYV